ncbi:ABC transporter substrate-binding protein [Alicyclobacillus fodiniaquatilis]|uniref:ABC transporter substrate-binding protein n=1 Tax=Alicyclobacillus fodiniaquatilis TaxID=1661150 RepID=A0ABW4JDU4_9BACL
MKKKVVKVASSVGITLSISIATIGCASPSQSQSQSNQTVTITFWDRHPELQTILTQAVNGFEKKYPNIKVKFQEIPVTTETQQYQAAVSGNSLPDVFALSAYSLPQYVALNTLHSLNSIFPASVQKTYPAGTFTEGYSTMGDQVYMLPMYAPDHSGNMLYYNKDLLKKYGLGVPTTWNQLMTESETIYQKSGGKVYGLAEPMNNPGLLSEIASSISPAVDSNGFNDKTGQYEFDSPGYVQVMNFFKEMMTGHALDPDDVTTLSKPQARAALAAGQAAFEIDGDWGGELIQGLGFKDWGVAKLPTWNRKPYYWGYTGPTPEGLAINANTKHWQQASTFVKYLANYLYPLMANEGYDTAKIVKPSKPAFSQVSQILNDLESTSVALPNVYQRNSATINVMEQFDSSEPTQNIGTILQGYLTGQVKDVTSSLQKLTSQYNQLLAKSIQQSNGKVTEKDFQFPNWVPFKSYTNSDYTKLGS